MPKNTRQLEVQVADQDEQTRVARQGALAGAIPQAKEPLKAPTVNSTGDLLARAVETLSGGQAPAPKFERVKGTVDMVPPDLGAHILTMGAFVEQTAPKMPELEPYKFDPVSAMETNAGLVELQGILGGLTSDKKVLGALQGPAPAPEQQAPPDEGGGDVPVGE